MSLPRFPPTASSSSMKTMAGAALRATRNRRRMRAAPRPANISTNEAADCAKNWALASLAAALARSVFPVPGGPWSRMPFGTFAPSFLKRFGSRRNSTISRSSSFASSAPATSSQRIDCEVSGLISCGFVRGMKRIVMPISTTIAPMKISGPHVSANVERSSQKLVPGVLTLTAARVAAALAALSLAVWSAGAGDGAFAAVLTHTASVGLQSSRTLLLAPADPASPDSAAQAMTTAIASRRRRHACVGERTAVIQRPHRPTEGNALPHAVSAIAALPVVRLGALQTQDLPQGRSPHLELLRGWLASADGALDLVPRPAQHPRQSRASVALGPGEYLHRDRHAAERHGAVRKRTAQARPADRDVADGRTGEQGRDEVRAAALVLLAGLRRVLVLLVGGDRLVLDAVIRGQVTAPQCEERRHQADPGHRQLARHGSRSRCAKGLTRGRRAGHRTERADVLHRQLGLGQRALHERDDRERLSELGHAADARDAGKRSRCY